MASRKKEPEGIALLSMYNDEDDEDMEDIEEDDHQQAEGEHDQPPLQENDHGESNNMEEDSRTDDNKPPFPHQTSTSSQHQRLVSPKSSGRGKLNIVDYGHDEAGVSPEHEQVELGSNDDLLFGLEHIANGKASPSAVQGTPESSDVEPLQPEANNAVSDSAGDKVDPLDKFLPPPSKDKCSEELQRRIDKFLYLKRAGKSYNAEVRNKKDYRNPDFLLHAVQYQDIDQIGSCFSKDVFDPHGYDKTDYYDEIEADMKLERERKEQESKKNLKVEFVSDGSQPGAVPTAPKLGMPIAAVTPLACLLLQLQLITLCWMVDRTRNQSGTRWIVMEGILVLLAGRILYLLLEHIQFFYQLLMLEQDTQLLHKSFNLMESCSHLPSISSICKE